MKLWNTEEYKNELVKRNIQVLPLEDYIKSNTQILHKCLKCNDNMIKSPNEVFAYDKQNIVLCPTCSGRKLIIGKNTLWDTHPEVAEMLVIQEEGYKNRYTSEKKLDWICPECGEIVKQKSIHNTVANGLVCPICGNTRSKGHRIVNSILSSIGIEYINEKTFYWSDQKSYDIYLEDINCIIEVNGIQHYEYCDLLRMSGKTIDEEQANDAYKKEIALNNGIIHYIVIDARKSDYGFIINNIQNNSDFTNLFNIDNVNWDKILTSVSNSEILKICDLYNNGITVTEIEKIVHMSGTVIQRHLHTFTNVGLCNYKGLEENAVPVICITTGEEFKNLKDAGNKYNIDPNGISFVCNGLRNRKYAGKSEDGTKLKWLLKSDYDNKTEQEILDLLNIKKINKINGASKVVCLNTKEVFDKIVDAQKKYKNSGISDCCRHIGKSSGIHPLSGEKLKWLYYSEYITLTEDELLVILNDTDYDDKRVMCINTGEVFESITLAGEWCGVGRSGICNVISGRHETNGKHPETGEQLRWVRYKDYLKLNSNEESNLNNEVAFSI